MDTITLTEIILAIVGIGATIYYGAKTVANKHKQKQTNIGSGISIQSGRDTRINRNE